MFCTKCGTECRAESSFCRNCGAPVGAGSAQAATIAASSAGPAAQPAASWQAPPVPAVQTVAGWQTAQPAARIIPPSPPPSYRLYDSGAVGLATFFGSPLAGALLMAVNYNRLGKRGQSVLAVILGAIGTAALIAIGWNLSRPVTGGLGIGALVGITQMARAMQGADVKAHVARGGQLASKWLAFGIGVATTAVLFGAVVLGAYEIQNRNQVTIGTKDQVFYSGTATKADATALGNALKTDGYFQDRGVTVLLDKGTGGTTISFVVQDGVWNQAGILSSFEQIAWQVASSVGGCPVQVHLVNSSKDVEITSTVGQVAFDGGDTVIYEGTATQAQAQALGQQLKTMGFFEGRGVSVFVAKHNDGTTLAFVVGSDAWDNPTDVSDFETIARDVAPAIGGLPLHLELDDNTLNMKKDELLQ